MSRMEINALKSLIDPAEGVGYTLPAELLDAYRTYRGLLGITIPEAQYLSIDDAAARVVAAATSTKNDLDLEAVAREAANADHERKVFNTANHIVSVAVEQAAEAATNLAADLTETIITDHLAPAVERVYAETAEAAKALDGFSLDPHAVITAPAKVRNAYAKLPQLADRREGIYAARRRANVIGHRKAEQDVSDLYATFRKPLAFHPDWKHPRPLPTVPFPEDRIESLLWMVSDAAKAAEPWFPTVAQQDAEWWKQFGEGIATRQQAHRNAQAVGARIG